MKTTQKPINLEAVASAESHSQTRLDAIKSLRGIIPDNCKNYDDMREEYLEEHYGVHEEFIGKYFTAL